jgi:hypothetical protein
VKLSLAKKSNAGGITKPDFKLSYSSLVTKYRLVMAQKQTHKDMEKSRNKPIQI